MSGYCRELKYKSIELSELEANTRGATLISRAYLDCANGKRGARFNAYTYTGDGAVSIIPSINLNVDSDEAIMAKSVHDQFLQTRPDFSQFRIPITLSDRSQGILYLDSYEFAYPPVDENLASRAWALQERLLSPRVLEYGWRTVRWTCSCCNGYSGDTELSAVNDGPILTKHEPQYSLFLYVTPAGFRNFPGSREELFKGWARIVAVYSNLELSDRQHRLAAIGGITQELERITKVPYLAGLWKYERLSSLLLWNITLPAQKLILRPKPNRAPSWSWAAVDGPVLIHQSEEVADGFEIVSSSVSGGFSKTARGSIIIEGPSRTGKWWRSVERLRIGYDDNTTWDEDCIIYPDCIDELVRFTDGDLSLSDVDLTFIAIGRPFRVPGGIIGTKHATPTLSEEEKALLAQIQVID
ncbi:hypothetical protein CHU98_g7672 [Xylaria longipes]|nr:hypothetical protein CHU98_g7672 [Xylaria longipes]